MFIQVTFAEIQIMTNFRTELNISAQKEPFQIKNRFITMGSCFAEVMGRKMQHYKLSTLVNPFGTIFNPLSLGKLLVQALNPDQEFTGELVERDGYWYAYDLHSSFAATTRSGLTQNIKQLLQHTHTFLAHADVLILTFGTAVAYVHKESGQVVANCHKIPQRYFEKQVISISEMLDAFRHLYPALQQLNPNLRIILTVSPVRHLKETLELNSVSKSSLRVFCHEIIRDMPAATYFPAYELMLDDLRDYRFYKSDMIHPSEVAEDYIWDKFRQAYFDAEFQKFTQEWDQIQQALHHRPFQPESAAHQVFLRHTLARLEKLQPLVDCAAEIAAIKKQLR